MAILALGINHKTAPVELREKVAFSDEKRLSALQQIQQSELAESAVILSTCNRTELYLHNRHISPLEADEQNSRWIEHIVQWFVDFHGLLAEQVRDNLYLSQNSAATQHLMRVACGLDSLILGEPQILGQVKQAYQASESLYQQNLSAEFSRLFQKTFATAKRVRSETDIGGSAVSVAYAATSLAKQIFDSLQPLTILLVGAGETIELVSRYLFQQGAEKIIIANRTLSRAQELSERVGTMELLLLDQLQQGLNRADIVITSTASDTPLISAAMVKAAQKQRKNRSMLIIDIAVPRDVEQQVSEIDSVYHYSVDDLQHIIRHNLAQRQKASEQAEQIIQQESTAFFQWLKLYQSSNLIRKYRDQAEQTRQELLSKALSALQQGQDQETVLQELSYKLTNRLLHAPTQAIQKLVKSGDSQGLQQFSTALGIESAVEDREN
ncbi:glutamyl-tRNA reductase [Testudinibacter sp. TR-2022]|uniref:glutamyl-tRNA reductase n=1 Tax=Testudinibacter sp. TR-2022 TaxID=2585029 RepID=UPI001118F95D|nr:glutamyl-tRNA reductase [Testudinibacter sp. TR-2022]TNH09556.1 glutamyl-tRNA reductase [Pasteurellaceae bacterium Phil11]TNH25150.1 glutamyl-tRNA reductase [Testudinibacter sp. TR-2022]TNH26968.1 glutamyl-tRNA reductase [Testudinibacter sp. TR-2022]